MSFCIGRAEAACYGTILAQGVSYAESNHSILVFSTFRQFAKELSDDHKGVAIIEVIAVDDTEWFFDNILTHQYGMIGTPWFLSSFWNAKAFG